MGRSPTQPQEPQLPRASYVEDHISNSSEGSNSNGLEMVVFVVDSCSPSEASSLEQVAYQFHSLLGFDTPLINFIS